jgi:RNA polymerase sigma-70 factor (ECF subfamily)
MPVSLDVLERLYRERFPRFLRTARALTGDDELALDAVQEAFARAIRARLMFRGDASAETWLWRMLINVCRDERRRAVRRQVMGSAVVDLPGAIASQNGRHTEPSELREAIAALPERQRLILFLYHYADLDQLSVAEITGVSRGTVAATLHQAHTALRRVLTEVAS